MAIKRRSKVIPADAIAYVAEINDYLIRRKKSGAPATMKIPSLFDRAFLLYNEAGFIPIEEVVSDVRESD